MLDNALQRRIIEHYCKRLAKIKHEDHVLVLVSFGGIIVRDIEIISFKKVIIISSVKSMYEYQSICKFLEKQKAIKIFLLIGLMILQLLLDLFRPLARKKMEHSRNIFL